MLEKEAEYLGEYASIYGGVNMKLEMSPEDKRRAHYGENNQGDGLVERKMNSPKRNASAKKQYRHNY